MIGVHHATKFTKLRRRQRIRVGAAKTHSFCERAPLRIMQFVIV